MNHLLRTVRETQGLFMVMYSLVLASLYDNGALKPTVAFLRRIAKGVFSEHGLAHSSGLVVPAFGTL